MRIESLEPRIAPASVITYTDIDGDLVRITATKGTLEPANLTLSNGTSGALTALDVTAAAFSGADILFSVVKKPGGDGLAHVGFLDATGVDLRKVVIKGNLARLEAGASLGTESIALLNLRSFGAFGIAAQSPSEFLFSSVEGSLGKLQIARDMLDVAMVAGGKINSIVIGGSLVAMSSNDSIPSVGRGTIYANGPIGSITIGKDLVGGRDIESGAIVAGANPIGPVKIGGSVIGGTGALSGRISGGDIASVKIGKQLIGGAGTLSGWIAGKDIGPVKVGGSVLGGSGERSGGVEASGTLASVTIGGSVIGGTANFTGRLFAEGDMGPVKIGGDLAGGSSQNALRESGVAASAASIASVALGGSLIASNTADGTLSGAISAGGSIGSVVIGGSMLGAPGTRALIEAVHQESAIGATLDLAIGSVRVKGDVILGAIRAGVNTNPDASIGRVDIGGSFRASDIVAGAQDGGAPGFGSGDTLSPGTNTAFVAQIVSIRIGEDVQGSLEPGDSFGFVAQQIGSLRIGPRTFSLQAGASNDNFPLGSNPDVFVEEVN